MKTKTGRIGDLFSSSTDLLAHRAIRLSDDKPCRILYFKNPKSSIDSAIVGVRDLEGKQTVREVGFRFFFDNYAIQQKFD